MAGGDNVNHKGDKSAGQHKPEGQGLDFGNIVKGAEDLFHKLTGDKGQAQNTVNEQFGTPKFGDASHSAPGAHLTDDQRHKFMHDRLQKMTEQPHALQPGDLLRKAHEQQVDRNGVSHGDKMPTLGLLPQPGEVPSLGLLNQQQQRMDQGFITNENQRISPVSFVEQPQQNYMLPFEQQNQINEVRQQNLGDGFNQLGKLIFGDKNGNEQDRKPMQGFRFKSHINEVGNGPF